MVSKYSFNTALAIVSVIAVLCSAPSEGIDDFKKRLYELSRPHSEMHSVRIIDFDSIADVHFGEEDKRRLDNVRKSDRATIDYCLCHWEECFLASPELRVLLNFSLTTNARSQLGRDTVVLFTGLLKKYKVRCPCENNQLMCIVSQDPDCLLVGKECRSLTLKIPISSVNLDKDVVYDKIAYPFAMLGTPPGLTLCSSLDRFLGCRRSEIPLPFSWGMCHEFCHGTRLLLGIFCSTASSDALFHTQQTPSRMSPFWCSNVEFSEQNSERINKSAATIRQRFEQVRDFSVSQGCKDCNIDSNEYRQRFKDVAPITYEKMFDVKPWQSTGFFRTLSMAMWSFSLEEIFQIIGILQIGETVYVNKFSDFHLSVVSGQTPKWFHSCFFGRWNVPDVNFSPSLEFVDWLFRLHDFSFGPWLWHHNAFKEGWRSLEIPPPVTDDRKDEKEERIVLRR